MKERQRPSWFRGVIEGSRPTEEVVRSQEEDMLHTLSAARMRAPEDWQQRTDPALVHAYRIQILSWNDEQILYHLKREDLFEDVDLAKAIIDVAAGRWVPALAQ